MNGAASVWLARHGQTEWSRSGRHTGRTDLPLTPEGEKQAEALVPFFATLDRDLVLCSPRQRARHTAELAGLVPYEVDDDLQEWDYGDLEGLTTAQIREDLPGWTIWDGPWPGGESAEEVAGRADRLLERVRGAGRVVLVGHGHFSRVIAARWIDAPPSAGRWLSLDTAAWSELVVGRDGPALGHWNVPVTA